MPVLLSTLEFVSNNTLHRPVLRALALVKKYLQSGLRYYPVDEQVPLREVVRADWQEMVLEEDQQGQKRVNRITYELCVLRALREKLRCKEIWVPEPIGTAIPTRISPPTSTSSGGRIMKPCANP